MENIVPMEVGYSAPSTIGIPDLPVIVKTECLSPSSENDDELEELECEEETDVEDLADNESQQDCKFEKDKISPQWIKILRTETIIKEFPFIEDGIGPRNILPELKTPEEFFNLFVDLEFLLKLTTDTNSAFDTFIELNPSVSKVTISGISVSLHEWIPINVHEMKVFLALILATALVNKPNLTEFWDNKNWLFATPNFPLVLTKERFILLLKFLYYEKDPSSLQAYNSEFALPDTVRPIMDIFNEKFIRFYNPDKDIYIDDILINVKERAQYLQHLSTNKCRDYGIRMWQLCDSSSGYCCKLELSVGLRNDIEHSSTNKIVFGLMENYLDKGHHLHIDSFCTTIGLCNDLYNRCTHITGVTCSKNSELPLPVRKNSRFIEKPPYFRNDKILVSSYHDCNREEVRLISTLARASDIYVVSLAGEEIKIPEIVHTFHAGMGGDNRNNNLTWYLDNRMGLQTWKRIFLNILCRSLQNTYILYMSMNRRKFQMPVPNSAFYMEVVSNLINEYLMASLPIKKVTATFMPFTVKSINTYATSEDRIGEFEDDLVSHVSSDSRTDTGSTEEMSEALAISSGDEGEEGEIKCSENEGSQENVINEKQPVNRTEISRSTSPVEHVLEPLPAPRKCSICKFQGRTQNTRYYCSTCIVGLCVGQCFIDYHNPNYFFSQDRPFIQ